MDSNEKYSDRAEVKQDIVPGSQDFYSRLGATIIEFVILDHMERTKYHLQKTARDESWYRCLDAKAHNNNFDSDKLMEEVAGDLKQQHAPEESVATTGSLKDLAGQVSELASTLHQLNVSANVKNFSSPGPNLNG
jgi:hypothetical protein